MKTCAIHITLLWILNCAFCDFVFQIEMCVRLWFIAKKQIFAFTMYFLPVVFM